MMPTLKISSEQDGKRLDVILARQFRDYSRSFLQKWIRDGKVTLAGKELIPNYRVQVGEMIEVTEIAPSPALRAPSPIGRGTSITQGEGKSEAPKVLFEDKSILVLNKPAGLVVHPAPSHKGSTLVDWLEDYLGPKVTGLFADSSRLGVVHRLDKDTTGVLMVAKTVTAQNAISKQFQDRIVKKKYVALIEGIPKAQKGVISAPVGRSQNVPSRMAVSSQGRPSETSFEVVESCKEVSLVSLYPKTGRTHQIRVHCAAIGHPIVGDSTYGSQARWSKEYGIKRPLLHAERLELQHPTTRKKIHFEAPWPADMKKALALFRRSFKVLVMAAIFSATVKIVDAETTTTPVKRKSTHSSQTSASSSGGEASSATRSLRREMASIKEQFKALIEEVSALQDRVTGIQSSMDELAASRRLRDLEKAISDLNGKAVNTSNVSEETKTQMLDLSRKVKAQSDLLDQLRDQVDRLQRQVIQKQTREESAPPEIDQAAKP